MNYYSSDFHLGHKSICKYRPQFSTPEEHDECVLQMMEKLTKRDILYVLGDFLFEGPKYKEYLERIKKMPVRIKLVMGNHDCIDLYKDCIGSNIEIQLPLFSHKNMWISHAPIHTQEIRGRLINIHGHLHGGVVMLNDIQDRRYFNVNLDNNNFEFVHLDTIKQYVNNIKKDLPYTPKIFTFKTHDEAKDWLFINTENVDFKYHRLRGYEIVDMALQNGYIIDILEDCPINGFKSGYNLDKIKQLGQDNSENGTTPFGKNFAWLYDLFKNEEQK